MTPLELIVGAWVIVEAVIIGTAAVTAWMDARDQ